MRWWLLVSGFALVWLGVDLVRLAVDRPSRLESEVDNDLLGQQAKGMSVQQRLATRSLVGGTQFTGVKLTGWILVGVGCGLVLLTLLDHFYRWP